MNTEKTQVLFELKQKFLREFPHPTLIAKYAKQAYANSGLTHELVFNKYERSKSNQEITLNTFLEGQIETGLQFRYKIATTSEFNELAMILKDLYDFQIQLMFKLQSYLPQHFEWDDREIKMSTPMDVYKILKMIRDLNLKENEIKDYLYKKLTQKIDSNLDLVDEFLRANKIAKHVGI